jgi:hypothetical protein
MALEVEARDAHVISINYSIAESAQHGTKKILEC